MRLRTGLVRRHLLPIVAVPLLAAGLTACGTQTGSVTASGGQYAPSPSSSEHTSLHLSSLVGPLTVPGGGRLRTAVALPAAPSGTRSAYDLSGDVRAEHVQRLGALLGLHGTARRQGDSWVLQDTGHGTLTVATGAGHRWTMHQLLAAGGRPGTPVPAAPSGNASTSSAAARTLLGTIDRATGRGTDPIAVVPAGSSAIASAEHAVDGLTVVGFDSQVAVDGTGQALSGHGWFGPPVRAAGYRLISAAQAVRRVPVPTGGMHPDFCVRTTGGAACAGQPRTVTGAHLGLLAAQRADGGYVLVPAWLLSIDGQSQPLAVVAVVGDQLSTPAPSPTG